MLFKQSKSRFVFRLFAIVISSVLVYAQLPAGWHDPSPHKVQFIRVQENVQLEVLDWGGAGRPLVLLAGAGCTAHIYGAVAWAARVNRRFDCGSPFAASRSFRPCLPSASTLTRRPAPGSCV